MPSKSRKLLLVLIGLLVLGFVLYRSSGMISLADFSGAKLLRAVRNANPWLLILSIIAIYACYALRSLRWKVFQNNLGPSRFGPIYKMTLAGFAAIFMLGRAGEPVRPLLLSRKEKLPYADMFGIYALERLFDFGATAVIGALALILYQSHGYQAGLTNELGTWPRKAGMVLLAFVAGGILTLVYYWGTRSFGGRLGTLGLGDVMLVMAFSLVGSVVQLPAVGGGAQLASV